MYDCMMFLINYTRNRAIMRSYFSSAILSFDKLIFVSPSLNSSLFSDPNSRSFSLSPEQPMSDDTPPETTATTTATTSDSPSSDSISKAQTSIEALSSILTTIPPSLPSSTNPAFSLLHDPEISSQISSLLQQPNSGAGDNNLCRWLYDTFQSSDPNLQLVVLRFLPIIAGVYLSSVALRKSLAGFEAVLLALYAHETTARAGQSITINVPDLSHSSLYHESKAPMKNNSMDLNLAVISPSLEPYGTVRSTRRARIVGVALELYYSKISHMPVGSKKDFCHFCVLWAGQDGDMYKEESEIDGKSTELGVSQLSQENEEKEKEKERGGKEGRIPLPWELLQPVLRILGHCLLGPNKDEELYDAACGACRSLYARSVHDIDPRAILATESLLRLGKMSLDTYDDFDPTELPNTSVITP